MSVSAPISGQSSLISQHLCAARKILQDVGFDASITSASNPDATEFDALEQEVSEVLRLVRSWRNRLSPINRVPPEILSLIPDFLPLDSNSQGVIALSHVCRTWREVFLSRASLWTNFTCEHADQTRAFLERSKSSPINLWLDKDDPLSLSDPLLQLVHSTHRFKSVSIDGSAENIPEITSCLCNPAPSLEYFLIDGDCDSEPWQSPPPIGELFNGDLSSLHRLLLLGIRTNLPWRNMVNLTDLVLCHASSDLSIENFLDFLESAPRLCTIHLYSAIPTIGTESGRLASLPRLERMLISGTGLPSPLLDHLLIPIGAKLSIRVDSDGSLIDGIFPTPLDNLRNLSDFTQIKLDVDKRVAQMQFTGPNGLVNVSPEDVDYDLTSPVLRSLNFFDTSKTERLKIIRTDPPCMADVVNALASMGNLRSLSLNLCNRPSAFVRALHISTPFPGAMACPKLEELVLVLRPKGHLDEEIRSVVEMVEARALAGLKLKVLKIANWVSPTHEEVRRLEAHVEHVEHGPGVKIVEDRDSDWENE